MTTRPYGFLFGGGGGGTIALAVDQDDNLLTQRGFRVPDGLPDMAAVAAARAQRSRCPDDIRAGPAGPVRRIAVGIQTPVRILTESVQAADGETYAVQIVGDRTAEQRTLDVDAGGPARSAAWWSCWSRSGSGRSMRDGRSCPIRESLANQRVALRRQREFAADASHELRTPLTVIRSSVEHLERHRDEPVATVGSALEDIDDEVRHMTAIVEDLLLLARSDSGAVALEHVPVDLGDVAADGASAMGKPATDRGVRVEVDPQPAVVAGDPARLRQLVMILVDNAIRHSPTDGRVGVAVRAERERGVARRRGRRPGHPARGPAARLRAVLPGAGRAGWRDRPGPRDREVDRRPPRRPHRGRQPGRGRRPLRGRPAGDRGRSRLTRGQSSRTR